LARVRIVPTGSNGNRLKEQGIMFIRPLAGAQPSGIAAGGLILRNMIAMRALHNARIMRPPSRAAAHA
jgi:hypothetical protein